MKKDLTLFFLSICFFLGTVNAQIFVKSDASGLNDGSSWENAFTSLEAAFSAADAGMQVWVASGTYKPAGGDALSYFRFLNDIELYGGFTGTESMLSERDWDANKTILSGDHSGDDIPGNFDDNRSDNSRHVMWLTDTISNATVIDGFTFSNGNTAPAMASGDERRGGGLLTYGAPTIKNCLFTENRGYFGGGLYPRISGADGILIENCRFESNFAYAGGAMYANPPTMTVRNCSFSFNETDGSHGGAIYSNNNGGVMITGCDFESNIATAENRGGAIYIFHSPGTISNCNFTNNRSIGSSGGALMVRDDNDLAPFELNVIDCNFTGNSGNFGGAFGCYDEFSIVNLSGCNFKDNSSTSLGGATTNGFGGTSNFTDCNFEGNFAANGGGAIFNQNNGSNITLNGCLLNLNESEDRGGAISFGGDDEAFDTIPKAVLTIKNTVIEGNIALQQGGGINLSNADFLMENSLIHNNFATNTESVGGGISFNASDTIHTVFRIVNSTIADNISSIGSGIANWKGGAEGSSELTFQNTILHNSLGTDYEIEDGDPVAVSAGGNISSDATATDFFVGMNDLTATDPLFEDASSFNFGLAIGSPCIDAGVPTGAPVTDILGNPRIDEIDMGCFENQKTSGTANYDNNFGTIQIFPNPVGDELNLSFDSEQNSSLILSVTDQSGRLLFTKRVENAGNNFKDNIPVSHFPKGIYHLIISNGEIFNSEKFLK